MMKLKLLSAVSVLVLGSVQAQSNDRELSQFMVGTWVQPGPDSQSIETDLRPDGHFLLRYSKGAYTAGTWHIEGDVIFYHVTAWSPHSAEGFNGAIFDVPKPSDSTNRIRILDDNHVRNDGGTVSERER